MSLRDFTNDSNDDDKSTGNGGTNIGSPFGGMVPTGFNGMADDFDVSELLINYNEKFKNAPPVQFRDAVIHDCISILIGMIKPNPLLVGEAGTGKTAVIEDIARRLANNDPLIPDEIKGYTIYELPLSSIVAGSSLVGQVEAKTKAVIEFAADPKNKAILFIDEIHMLIGENMTYDKIAQQLKPSLARGDMRCIGATTLQESQNLKKDPAFNRRFNSVIVDELTSEQTAEIVKTATTKYNHRAVVAPELINTFVDMANEYHRPGSHRPDNALTLLDRTISDKIIARAVLLESIKDDPVQYQALSKVKIVKITKEDIKRTALHIMTGHAKKEAFSEEKLVNELSIIEGQDEILPKIIDLIKRHDLDLFPRTRPLTMLFGGASGVGKTEVAKRIASVLTGIEPIILNMTEYSDPATINNIIGSPIGYIGSENKTELPFDKLESNPYQVIVLDEFEKCHRSVKRLFMQVFEEGKLKDNRGNVIDFSRAIIIATTNAGYTTSKPIGFGDETIVTPSTLAEQFDVELLNRFRNNIYSFNSISKETYTSICKNCYAKLIANSKAVGKLENFPDEIDSDDLEKVVEDTYDDQFGARPAEDAIKSYIETLALTN